VVREGVCLGRRRSGLKTVDELAAHGWKRSLYNIANKGTGINMGVMDFFTLQGRDGADCLSKLYWGAWLLADHYRDIAHGSYFQTSHQTIKSSLIYRTKQTAESRSDTDGRIARISKEAGNASSCNRIPFAVASQSSNCTNLQGCTIFVFSIFPRAI